MMNETEFRGLPEAQRKAIQGRLKDQGLYFGKLDGDWGKGTETALRQEEKLRVESEQRERESRREDLKAEAEAETRAAEAERKRAETERLKAEIAAGEERAEQAASPAGIGTQIAANTGAPLAGYAVGRKIGAGLNVLADRSQIAKNRALEGAAQDRLSGLTTREGARVGTSLSGSRPPANALLRAGGRMLPHAITGAGMLAKGGALLSQGSEDEPFYPSMANRAAGLGMLGTGVGILEQGANYAINPGVAPDARSLAVMESNQLRRGRSAPASLPRG